MDVHWVDVFATGPLTGNPLAVIAGDRLPTPAVMQRIAAEMGLSETVFATPGDPPSLRIFTPEAEIPLAGHPLVGAAWVLRRTGWIGDRGHLATPGGVIAVAADDEGAVMVHEGPRRDGDAGAGELARCLGARARGHAPIWNAGLPQAMIEVDDLDSLQPDHAVIRERGRREGWVGASAYVLEPTGADAVVACVRHFAAPIGIDEDPVTGSAAGALGARLAADGMRTGDRVLHLVVRQGQHIGRPGEVRVRVSVGDNGPGAVEVGGAVVPVMAGSIGTNAFRG